MQAGGQEPVTGTLAPSGKPALRVRQLTFGYASKVLLRDVSFDLPQRGLIALMGPSGVGKSTLLRTIGRLNDTQPSFWARGRIFLDDENILDQEAGRIQRRISLLAQKARLYTASVLDNILLTQPAAAASEREEQAHALLHPWGLWDEFAPVLDEPVLNLSIAAHKKILIARLLAGTGISCLLLDEPLSEVAVTEEEALIGLIQRIARRLSVLMVTHSKPAARRLSETVCFVTGDRLVEVTPAQEFFICPRTELGREFLRSGSSWPVTGSDEDPAPIVPAMSLRPPREFHWILPGQLGGMHRPGLWGDTEGDLRALQMLGIEVLVSLTEIPFDPAILAAFAITGVHFPIADMSVPALADADALCTRISSWLDAGKATVLHCKAGLGRTGTMLACVLVVRGLEPERAIETVRTAQSGYIQTEEQLAFVGKFAVYLRHRHRR